MRGLLHIRRETHHELDGPRIHVEAVVLLSVQESLLYGWSRGRDGRGRRLKAIVTRVHPVTNF